MALLLLVSTLLLAPYDFVAACSCGDSTRIDAAQGGAVCRTANLVPDCFFGVGSFPSDLAVFNGELYFLAQDEPSNSVDFILWAYDGENPPRKIASSSFFSGLTTYNDKLYMVSRDSATGLELWSYDGTNAPSLAFDLIPGPESSDPRLLTVFNGRLYFYADRGLWSYDGTNPPSKDFDIDIDLSSENMAVFNNKLYFSVQGGFPDGTELWSYDGTNFPSMVADINPDSGSYPGHFAVFDGKLFFAANSGDGAGIELWSYNGSNFPVRVTDINPQGDSQPGYMTAFNGRLYFQATNEAFNSELWSYDGSNPPTQVAEISGGLRGSEPRSMTEFDGKLYFRAYGEGGAELWELDPNPQSCNPLCFYTALRGVRSFFGV